MCIRDSLQRTRLTLNHPRTFPGLVMWGEVVAALRDQLRPLDWIRQDVGGFPVTVKETLNLAIAVASGDEATGNPYAHPSNRSKKGRHTVDAIESNRQMVLLFEEFMQEVKQDVEGNQTWISVSYTHRDVYKRQVQERAHGGGERQAVASQVTRRPCWMLGRNFQ